MSGAVGADQWGLNMFNNRWDKVNGFYWGSGSFKICVRMASPAYADAKACGYAYNAPPQAKLTRCGTGTFSTPGLFNGDNSAHNFEIRAYTSC